MKKLIVLLFVALISFNAHAETDSIFGTDKKFGFTVNTTSNTMISGKIFTDKNTAILGGLGLIKTGSATDIYAMGGVRKYVIKDAKSTFLPFIGGRTWYSSLKSMNVKSYGLMGEAGAEFFLDRQFSIEGMVGFGYGKSMFSAGSSSSRLETATFSLAANFYFN